MGPDDTETLAKQYGDPDNLNARAALHGRFSTADRDLQEWQFDQFDLPADAAVLSVGGGDGDLWPNNDDRVPRDWSVVVTDRSPGMVEAARESLPDRYGVAVVEAAAIPVETASFDAVTANHMLYHVPDRQAALAEIRRVLRPGGALYATTIGDRHMAELKAVIEAVTDRSPASMTAGFTLENGRDQLEECFDEVEVRRHENGLLVTEAEPLVAYALSRSDVRETDEPALRAAFEKRVAPGPFEITKAVGMFVAR